MSHTFTTEIGDEEYEIEFDYIPSSPGCTGIYGEPLEPDYPEEIDIISVYNQYGIEIADVSGFEEAVWTYIERMRDA